MSKSVREQVEDACHVWRHHAGLSPGGHVLWKNRELFASAEELQSENARLRGVIEQTAQDLADESIDWLNDGDEGTAATFMDKANLLRAALQPQPVERSWPLFWHHAYRKLSETEVPVYAQLAAVTKERDELRAERDDLLARINAIETATAALQPGDDA